MLCFQFQSRYFESALINYCHQFEMCQFSSSTLIPTNNLRPSSISHAGGVARRRKLTVLVTHLYREKPSCGLVIVNGHNGPQT